MPNNVDKGFEDETIELNIDQVTPLKTPSKGNLESRKFKQIIASIREIGIIEPLVVFKQFSKSNQYILLDGHMRLEALKNIGKTTAMCLISKDDEAYTYNKYISRKAPIQEHRMIQKMVKNGVSEEKIARTLNINVKSIVQKRNLLDGICPEAIELLKDKMVATTTFRHLKKMIPIRQIECAMRMIDMNDFTVRHAGALLQISRPQELVDPEKSKITKTFSPQKQAQMQEELDKLEREYKLIRDDRGQKNLVLQFTKNYLGRLLDNKHIERYLKQNYPDTFEEFQKIADMVSLKKSDPNSN